MAKHNIKIEQGATFRLPSYWRQPLLDVNGNVVRDADDNVVPGPPNDLTGYTARCHIRKSVKDTAAMLTLTNANGGVILQPVSPVRMLSYVRATTTVPITLSGVQTVDGVTLALGDRVLVKNQAAAADNGIYVVAAGAWTRADDANTPAELTEGATVWVYLGTMNGDSVWRQTATIAALTDPQTWSETTSVGKFELYATDEQTAALTSSGVYDVELEAPGPQGDVYRPLEGKMRLSAEVTRA